MKTIIRRLVTHMRRRGLQQADVSAALGITQGHLSKVLAGTTPLAQRLSTRMEELLQNAERNAENPSELTKLVNDAMAESADFKKLVRLGLALTKKTRA